MDLSPETIAAALEQIMQSASGNNTQGAMSDDDLALHALDTRFNGHLAHDRSRGWFHFPAHAHHWVNDADGDDVTATVQTMLRELRRTETDSAKAKSLGSRQRRDNVVSMLKGLPEVRYAGEWDAEPFLLAAPNGVIDLRTGALRDGEPDQRLTRAVTVDYEPAARAPRWERFVAEIFAHDPALPAYVQRLLGYGITGSTREQCFAVLYGAGANGKSTLLTTLRELLGSHAATVPFDAFTVSGKARGGPEAEMLVGARLALASETNRSATLDSAAIKNATGGEEITVNPKYRTPYAFKPQALILLASNYKPIVREQDNGTWRRIKLIPFLQRFEGDAKDPHLEETLRSERAGILAWLVRGAVDWYANGLQDPDSVRAAINEYREESDSLAGFLPGVLELAPGRRLTNPQVWTAYEQWADANGTEAFKSGRTLGDALIERGKGAITRFHDRNARGLEGLAFADEQRQGSAPGIFEP
ncbi:phage/plasmid primase, P4 family [Streptomyces althioticus]|uniref:DNA primase family protein n=1 Tax=Streptomyces althioticus TaxID=83380 RepID=UPI003873B4EA|nr:phage/plasmid primase, P4 family [Streptomyces althioticus]